VHKLNSGRQRQGPPSLRTASTISYQAEVVAKAGSDGEVGDDDGLPNESSVSLRRTRPCRQQEQLRSLSKTSKTARRFPATAHQLFLFFTCYQLPATGLLCERARGGGGEGRLGLASGSGGWALGLVVGALAQHCQLPVARGMPPRCPGAGGAGAAASGAALVPDSRKRAPLEPRAPDISTCRPCVMPVM
jgi:hypothetical protein